MAIVLTYTAPTFSTGGDYFAQLAYAENGDIYGSPGLITGTGSTTLGYDWYQWEDDPADGIDTTYVPVAFELREGTNGLGWLISNESLTQNDVAAFNRIDHVDILAGVNTQAAIEWHEVYLNFYTDGVLDETVEIGDFGVDQTNNPYAGDSQILKTISPAHVTSNEVAITGKVRFTAPEGVYPGPEGFFSQVQVFFG